MQNTRAAILPLLPLKETVVMPGNITPLVIGRAASRKAIEYALSRGREICIVTQKKGEDERPAFDDLYEVGIRATLLQAVNMSQGNLKVLVEGTERVAINKTTAHDAITFASYTPVETNIGHTSDIQGTWKYALSLYRRYAKLSNTNEHEVAGEDAHVNDICIATDALTHHCDFAFNDKQAILEESSLYERIVLLCTMLQQRIDILEAEQRVKEQVQSQIDKNQKEYYLNEQIKALQKELGRDDQSGEIEALREQAQASHLPDYVREKIEREINRLEQMPSMAAEANVTKNYVEWTLSLPWNTYSDDTVSVENAEKMLEEDHAGLEKAKERILEFIAAKKFSPRLNRNPTLCLVGPPGVGKTSLARSVARTLNRSFARISLGGTRDEAEIRGHRRTYVGALPGKIIQALRTAGTSNPVILLDEIDKLGRDIQGDPSSALLEVLDPEQNVGFVDNFLEMGYDLSRVLFIATANHPEGIPHPLHNRMEVVSLTGYTDEEKVAIAERFLIPKHLKENNLTKRGFRVSRAALMTLIRDYSREAGVRQLERCVMRIIRKGIQLFLQEPQRKSITVTPRLCRKWLGVSPFRDREWASHDTTGFALGLAWTELGGEVLPVETSILSGKGDITLTGQLGEVMRESAQAALSYIRSRSDRLGLQDNFFSNHDVHIHAPEGATPKDGPSAGITMCTALVSACTNIPTKSHVAMTGEITLRGTVLPVGGIKEKLLAARRQGMTTVLLPHDNKADVQHLKESFSDLKVSFVKNMDEVLAQTLQYQPRITSPQPQTQERTHA